MHCSNPCLGDLQLGHLGYLKTQSKNPVNFPSVSGKVLIVEDNISNQELIKLNIEATGAKCDIAENGSQAIEKILREDYDLILMDIQMPIMDGKKAMETLNKLGCTVPIYALTANIMKDETEEYKRIGFRGILAKPFELRKVSRVLELNLRSQSEVKKNERVLNFDTKYNEIYSHFIEQLHIWQAELKADITDDKIGKVFHNIAGSAGNFGYSQLSKLALHAKQCLISGELLEIEGVRKAIYKEIEEILQKNV